MGGPVSEGLDRPWLTQAWELNPSKQSFTWAGDRLQEQALAQWKPKPEIGSGKGQ